MATAAQIIAQERIQFALLNEDGDPVECYKQDDSSYPLVAGSIESLIAVAAEAHDLGDDDFLRMLLDPDSEYGRYEIIRETVSVSTLSDKDKEALQKLLADFQSLDDEDSDDGGDPNHILSWPPEKTYQYDSIEECKQSGGHLTDCDNDGYCNKCGSSC